MRAAQVTKPSSLLHLFMTNNEHTVIFIRLLQQLSKSYL